MGNPDTMNMNAKFFVLKQQDESLAKPDDHFALAAQIAADQYRNGQRVFICVNDNEAACAIDEIIWAFDPDSFVPHNLQGEGPKGGAPVEIGITPPVGNRKVLINLATQLPDYIRRFNQVFDFVPVEAAAKQAARERFKKLRQLGANLTTQDINS
ncbi:DNA polymerase III subunit chi [Pseudoalteromonas sp. BSi20495]|nr:DNA polymerase III subunit chi [Pseudoalteromonas sp. BSi20495]